MRLLIQFALALLLLLSHLPTMAFAQETEPAQKQVTIDKRKLLVPPKNPDGSFLETPFAEDPVRWIQDKQRNFYVKISSSIRNLKSGSPATAAWTLLLISFLYGIFHAAGPGHGKAVISAWVLATENELKRGIVISALSAFFQALTAIVIVSALLLFVSGAAGLAKDVAGFLESASYALIAGMGVYLLWTALRGHNHDYQHTDHDPAPGPYELISPVPFPPGREGPVRRSSAGAQTDGTERSLAPHVSPHIHDEHCGHNHAPPLHQLKSELSWSRAVALAFAVGLRPCTGAFLVLLSAWQLGVYWAGVASTFAMGIGVFITTSAIAIAAVFAKSTALRFAALDNRNLARAVKTLKILGGLAIAALGGLMFWASLGSVNQIM